MPGQQSSTVRPSNTKQGDSNSQLRSQFCNSIFDLLALLFRSQKVFDDGEPCDQAKFWFVAAVTCSFKNHDAQNIPRQRTGIKNKMNTTDLRNTSPHQQRPLGSFSLPSSLRPILEIQETANEFDALIQHEQYEEASDLLADDFVFQTPAHNYRGKKDWLKKFPRAHKDMPTMSFGEYEASDNHTNQIERRGTKKIAFINITIRQVVEVDDEGKIKSIVASTA